MLQNRIPHPGIEPGVKTISVHAFTSAFSLWARGDIAAADISSFFNLDADEVTQVQNLKGVYDGLTTAAEKADFLFKVEHAGVLYEAGAINAAKYAAVMGL